MIRFFIPATTIPFIFGCVISYFVSPDVLYVSCFVLLFSLTLFLIRRNRVFIILCVCVVSFALGMLRILFSGHHQEYSLVSHYPDTVLVQGVITGDIEDTRAYNRYIVAITSVNGDAPTQRKVLFLCMNRIRPPVLPVI